MQTNQQHRIYRAIEFMETHLQEAISLEDLAAAAGFSPYYFHRIFSAWMGETPIQFLHRLRLERALNLMQKNPSLSFTRIAATCGFASASVFSRAFKQRLGVAPRQYRQQMAAQDFTEAAGPAQKKDLEMTKYLQNLRVETLPDLDILAAPTMQGYSLNHICRVWTMLMTWAQSRNLLHADTWRLGLSFDDPHITPQAKCRYYAGLTLREKVKPQGALCVFNLPASTTLCAEWILPVDAIQFAYHWMFQHILPDTPYQYQGSIVFERYLSPPDQRPQDPLHLIICIPVQ